MNIYSTTIYDFKTRSLLIPSSMPYILCMITTRTMVKNCRIINNGITRIIVFIKMHGIITYMTNRDQIFITYPIDPIIHIVTHHLAVFSASSRWASKYYFGNNYYC